MNTSKLKEFFRRDWQTFKREFFARPSFWTVTPLLIVGAVLVTRSYLAQRRSHAESVRMERAVRQIDQQVNAALRESLQVVSNSPPSKWPRRLTMRSEPGHRVTFAIHTSRGPGC